MGATVTGLDFSPSALAVARDLFARTGTTGRFVENEVYDVPEALAGETFDLVYTGVGALCWLPDVRSWAQVVAAALLSPGGRLFLQFLPTMVPAGNEYVLPDRPERLPMAYTLQAVKPGSRADVWQTPVMDWSPDPEALRGRVAVVAGATRGAGVWDRRSFPSDTQENCRLVP